MPAARCSHSRAGHGSAQDLISYSSLLQRTVDQNVVIPVPDRGGRNLGLQGFSPIQSSTVQLASQKRSSERIVEQIVDSLVLGGGFRPVQGSSASSSSSREHADEGFFGLFPDFLKKSEGKSALGVGTECGLQSIHPERSSNGSERSALEPG